MVAVEDAGDADPIESDEPSVLLGDTELQLEHRAPDPGRRSIGPKPVTDDRYRLERSVESRSSGSVLGFQNHAPDRFRRCVDLLEPL